MRQIRLSVSRLMLAVLLATVLAPAFSWETVAGEFAHDDHPGASNDAAPWDDHHRPPTPDDEQRHSHDRCVGHSFSHLTVIVALTAGARPIKVTDRATPRPTPGRLLCSPKIPEHPPKAHASA